MNSTVHCSVLIILRCQDYLKVLYFLIDLTHCFINIAQPLIYPA